MPGCRDSRREVASARRYSSESRPPFASQASKVSWRKYGISSAGWHDWLKRAAVLRGSPGRLDVAEVRVDSPTALGWQHHRLPRLASWLHPTVWRLSNHQAADVLLVPARLVSSAEPAAHRRMTMLDECWNRVLSAIEADRPRMNGELAAQLGDLPERALTPPSLRLVGRPIKGALGDLSAGFHHAA
jgi:hypothetical protein